MGNTQQITVFTPTYNREKLLWRVFESLQKQTDNNFRWLIVDDGSCDATGKAVALMMEKSAFNIEYIYQENGGKHRAHNTAVRKCQTEYMLILDSDDYLTKDAISVLYSKIKLIQYENIAGIIGNRIAGPDGAVIGTPMPDIQYASGNELYQKYGLQGDTLLIYKTDILKKYLFPEIPHEKFVSENVVFDQIDRKYKLLAIKELLYVGEYQDKGYSNNICSAHLNSPVAYALSLKSSMETAVTLKKKISYMILYIIWSRKMDISLTFDKTSERLLKAFLYPVAYFFIKIKYPAFFFQHFENER